MYSCIKLKEVAYTIFKSLIEKRKQFKNVNLVVLTKLLQNQITLVEYSLQSC